MSKPQNQFPILATMSLLGVTFGFFLDLVFPAAVFEEQVRRRAMFLATGLVAGITFAMLAESKIYLTRKCVLGFLLVASLSAILYALGCFEFAEIRE